ncbi:MAG TPA: hypothetical protein VG755_17965 [Nannocystaceae bacterium]|nr:hypothetical protein [Nannocystaceae bacterium]
MARWQSGASVIAVICSACAAPLDVDTTASSSGGDTSSTGPGDASSASTTGVVPVCEDEGWDDIEGDEGAEDTTLGMGDDMPLPFTIAAVQHGEATGQRIALTGVVAVSPSTASEVLAGRELFVQDPAGGPWSGLRVVANGFDLGELLDPGDAADLVGVVVTFEGFVALEVVRESDVVRTGTVGLPMATPVTLADLAPAAPTARQYEGVVVQIADVTVTDAHPCIGELVLDHVVRVDDRFVPGDLDAFEAGAAVSSVYGVFVRASGSYELAPPATDALQ